MNKRVKSMLSLCCKAGMLVSGETACEKALQAGKAKLVIVARDASENTAKKFSNKSFYYEAPVVVYGEKEWLGGAVGRKERAVMIITDEKFGLRIKELMGTDM